MNADISKELIDKYLGWQETFPPLYHYTSVYGLEGIIKSKDLWVSHANFLNDKTERKYTESILIKLIEEKLRDFPEKDILLEGIKRSLNSDSEVYVLSLSKNKDSNLLWSNYSQDDGYNIKFDFSYLYHLLEDQELGTVFKSKVIYEKEIHNAALNELADYYVETFPNIKKIGQEIFTKRTSAMLVTFQLLAAFFKDECFQQEEEYRIVIFPDSPDQQYECRVTNGAFIPYFKMRFNKSNVKGITIGPKNKMDISEEGLKSFLLLNKFDLENIEINRSKIPYRY
ncbi:DUF2971 domain-containing protein [Bacillus pumilus]